MQIDRTTRRYKRCMLVRAKAPACCASAALVDSASWAHRGNKYGWLARSYLRVLPPAEKQWASACTRAVRPWRSPSVQIIVSQIIIEALSIIVSVLNYYRSFQIIVSLLDYYRSFHKYNSTYNNRDFGAMLLGQSFASALQLLCLRITLLITINNNKTRYMVRKWQANAPRVQLPLW